MNKKVVLITGTSSGFGWLTANTVAAYGHKVYATMRETNGKNAERAKALSQIENITVLDVTLTNDNSVTNAIDTIIAKEGKIDILVNNAGYAITGVTESFTTTDVQEMFDINVFAPWRFMKHVLPTMRKYSEGLIINVSSGFGRFSFPFFAVYGASKFGLEGLTEGLHYEARPLGIDVSMIQPGGFPTEMYQKSYFSSDPSVNEGYNAIAGIPEKMGVAVGQMMEAVKPNPQDVADAVLKLINSPKGKRPLRTVVDPSTGEMTKAANEAVQVEYEKVLRAYGMKELLA